MFNNNNNNNSYEGLVDIYGQCEHLGVFHYEDGDVYEGAYNSGEMHGLGIYYTDGYMFMGEWQNNGKHGCGVGVYSNGFIEYGEWKYDQYLGQYTRLCPLDKSVAIMENAVDVAARAKMFTNKPNAEISLRLATVDPKNVENQDPVLYKQGEEWRMPGPAAELYTPPTPEEMGPEIVNRVRTTNWIWERVWNYYNVFMPDERREMAPIKAKQREEELLKSLRTEDDEEDEYAELYDNDGNKKKMKKPKQQKKKSKGGKNKTASLTISMMSASQHVQNAFKGFRRQLRNPKNAWVQKISETAQNAQRAFSIERR